MTEPDRDILLLLGSVGIRVAEIITGLFENNLSCDQQLAFSAHDTAVFVHLKMAERLCPQDFQHKSEARSMVSTPVKRAKPSYASEVQEFAGRIRAAELTIIKINKLADR